MRNLLTQHNMIPCSQLSTVKTTWTLESIFYILDHAYQKYIHSPRKETEKISTTNLESWHQQVGKVQQAEDNKNHIFIQ